MRIISFTLLSLTTLATYSAFGFSDDDDITFEDGFYASVALGANWAIANWDGTNSTASFYDDNFDKLNLFDVTTPSGDSSDDAKIIGSAGLGYQLVGDLLYLGAQISGAFSDTRNFNDDEYASSEAIGFFPFGDAVLTGTNDVQSTVTLGDSELDLELKPGILLLDNFLIYARAGVVFSELKINSTGEWSQITEVEGFDPVELATSASTSNNESVVGFRVGVGLEYLFTEHLGVSLDYIFTDYGDVSTVTEGKITGDPADSPLPPPIADLNHIHGLYAPEVSVTTHAVMAGLVYHFD